MSVLDLLTEHRHYFKIFVVPYTNNYLYICVPVGWKWRNIKTAEKIFVHLNSQVQMAQAVFFKPSYPL